VDKWFRRLQLVSAGAYSLGHGGNDAQKTIGIIWMLLIATNYASPGDKAPPTWVILCCYTAIGAGTMFGGWRIVKTMGQKITKLKPVGGFCAETGGAITLLWQLLWVFRFPLPTPSPAPLWVWGLGQCCALGGGWQYCVGVGVDYSGQRFCSRCCLLGQSADFLIWMRCMGVGGCAAQTDGFFHQHHVQPALKFPAAVR
jgi:hypothetical protein